VSVSLCGCVTVWVCHCVGVSLCGCVTVCVTVWVCHCVGVSLRGCVEWGCRAGLAGAHSWEETRDVLHRETALYCTVLLPGWSCI